MIISGGPIGTDFFSIFAGFDDESDPLCQDVYVDENDCLDSGHIINLQIETPVYGIVSFECGSAVAEVLDNDGKYISICSGV